MKKAEQGQTLMNFRRSAERVYSQIARHYNLPAISLYIDNFSEDKQELPIGICYENGWWCLYADEHDNYARFLQVEETVNNYALIYKYRLRPTWHKSMLSENAG